MIVYLDGENVVHQLMDVLRRSGRLKSREDLLKVNVVELIQQLIGAKDVKIKYYTTTLQVVKTDEDMEKRSQDMIAWTALWTNHLIEQGIEIVKAGRLRARDGIVCKNCGHQEAVFREKGVDVRLAVDLVVDSEHDKTLVIWSSDADLTPAVEVVKGRGARVKILASKDSLTWGLARQAGEWQTYTDGQLIRIFDKANKSEKHEANDGN
jgi:uncharacterized LabA/DUF88 family protein